MTTLYAGAITKGDPGDGMSIIAMETGAGVLDLTQGEHKRAHRGRLELEIAVRAAELAPTNEQVTIVVYSEYVYNGATKWVSQWASTGWRTKRGQEVKNVDLWKRLLALGDRKIHWFLDPMDEAKACDETSANVIRVLLAWRLDGARESKSDDPVAAAPVEVVVEPVREIPMNYGVW